MMMVTSLCLFHLRPTRAFACTVPCALSAFSSSYIQDSGSYLSIGSSVVLGPKPMLGIAPPSPEPACLLLGSILLLGNLRAQPLLTLFSVILESFRCIIGIRHLLK